MDLYYRALFYLLGFQYTAHKTELRFQVHVYNRQGYNILNVASFVHLLKSATPLVERFLRLYIPIFIVFSFTL